VIAPAHRIVPAGESALILELEDRIDLEVNARAIRVAAAVVAARVEGVRDVVPTYRSVAVYFDPLRTNYDRILDLLTQEAAAAAAAPASEAAAVHGAPVRIPVRYGGDEGPDLAEVAAFAGLTDAQVIERHAARIYRVFMMGFVPGFPYMGIVDPRIAAPRRAAPRLRVARGSVGIAGSQTGIYPADTPGGWQVIGRTPIAMFDPAKAEPFLLKPGDAVQFVSIA
jgi:KipI family sensor histidine kinase inhibitor